MSRRWLPLAVAAPMLLSGCAGHEPAATTGTKSSVDPRILVVRLSDLPASWAPVPGESLRVPLAWVLRDPSSAGVRGLIRRERVAGYESSFWSPERRRVECEVSVYRSPRGARTVFPRRVRSFEAFLAASARGRRLRVEPIGEASAGYRLEGGAADGVAIVWRYRSVLARCTGLGSAAAIRRETELVAGRQQRRLARLLG